MSCLTTFFMQQNLFETLSPLLASADGADSSFRFWAAAIIFVATFVLIATEKIHKTAAVLVGAALMLLFVLPVGHHEESAPQTPDPVKDAPAAVTMKVEKATETGKAVKLPETPKQISNAVKSAELETVEKYEKLDSYSKYVNFDVIFTLAGMMVMVNILSKTGLFQYIAIKSVKFAKGQPARTMILLVLATAFLSAFLDNVTTVLLVVPVTFVVSSQMKVSPVPFILAETMASNIGGTATLIGDPPNLLIGSMVGLNFMAFLINLAPFIVLLLLGYCAFLYFHYSKHMTVTVEQRAKIMEMDEKTSITDPVTLKKAGIVMLLTIVGFLVHGVFGIQPSVVAMTGAALCLTICKVNVDQMLEKIEWGTLFFFMGLFIIVQGADYAGVMEKLGSYLHFTASWHPLLIILTMMWICGLAVAIINNVSFTAVAVTIIMAFMKTVPVFQGNVPLEHLMWWGVALALCLGGNFTLFGAAANLVVVGLAQQAGEQISFKRFAMYGVPVTIYALILSSIYITIRYFAL